MTAGLSESALADLGGRLAGVLPRGAVVWLEGALGSGKTTLARAIVAARGAAQGATSPTFNLVHRYDGTRGHAFHVDCYRMRHPDEARELDWEEMLASDVLLVEWPERGGAWVPAPTLRIHLGHATDPDLRMVRLEPPLEGLA